MVWGDVPAMTSFDQQRCFTARAPAWLLAAALSSAAGVAVAQDKQAPAAPAATPAAPAQQAPEKPASPAPAAAGPAPAAPVPDATAHAPPQPQPPAASGASKPGFFDALGRWWQQSTADWNAKMKDAQKQFDEYSQQQKDAMKSAAEATKSAATAIWNLPKTRVIEVHETCAKAANGAPDCQEAAVKACRAKGYGSGQPADVSSSEKCATTMWLSGQSKEQAPCRMETETVVTRAVCQ